jgi:hypothetical protein
MPATLGGASTARGAHPQAPGTRLGDQAGEAAAPDDVDELELLDEPDELFEDESEEEVDELELDEPASEEVELAAGVVAVVDERLSVL